MNKNQFKLICFDVDGTLVDGISWFFLTEGLGCSIQQHMSIFQEATTGKISFKKGDKKLVEIYQNSKKASKSFIKKIFSRIETRPEAEEIIDYLKKKGYLIYLISGGIDLYVREVAKKLRVNGFYANSSLEFDSKDNLKKIYYRGNQGKVKVEQIKELIKKLGIKINEVVFVGDSENDFEVFKLTKHGIAVNYSNQNLKKVAWRSVSSLDEIKKIL